MQASELTIGNYYQASIEFIGSAEAKLSFLEKRIFQLTKQNLILILQLNIEEHVHPIPITENWLLLLGFITNGFNTYRIPDKDDDELLNYFTVSVPYFETSAGASCKYLHEIQTLYFIIKNKELKFKQIES